MMRKTIICMMAAAAALISCSRIEGGRTGSLVIGEIGTESADGIVIDTRAVEAGLIVEIYDSQDNKIKSFAAGDPAAGDKIELEAGDYSLRAYTPNISDTFAPGQLGEPKYDGRTGFTIEEERTSYVGLIVPLVNTAVSLSLPDGFASWFPSYALSISIEGRSLNLSEGDTAWFDLTQDCEASYSFSATNTDGEHMESSGTFTASPGTSYLLSYKLSPSQSSLVFNGIRKVGDK